MQTPHITQQMLFKLWNVLFHTRKSKVQYLFYETKHTQGKHTYSFQNIDRAYSRFFLDDIKLVKIDESGTGGEPPSIESCIVFKRSTSFEVGKVYLVAIIGDADTYLHRRYAPNSIAQRCLCNNGKS